MNFSGFLRQRFERPGHVSSQIVLQAGDTVPESVRCVSR